MKRMAANATTLNEVSLLASVQSPYVVRYRDSFIEGGNLHLIMEYCEKGDLSTFLSSQKCIFLNEEKIWRIALEILSGLAALHVKGIIHRDIKSKNIFLTRDYHAKIGDFGLCACRPTAKAIQDHKELGTLLYASPEICKGEFYSAKTDIWSFGCVLYELCTLRTPFDANSEETIIHKILNYRVAPILKSYSSNLSFIVNACLNKDPNQRPTIMELLSFPCINST